MKVYKYLLSVIVMLGLISCSSEENNIINEVAPAAGQLTVAFNLSNEVAKTKAVGDIAPTNGEDNINTCALFICTAEDGEIIEKGFFNGNTSTFNFKPRGNQETYYVYAVANVSESTFNNVGAGASVSDLKKVTASIPLNGASASNLPKMGGRNFTIALNSSNVQNIGVIPVYQLVSSLQLQVLTNFTGATFVVTDLKWNNFSALGKIGGDNGTTTDESLFYGSSLDIEVNPSTEYQSVGSEMYTFPNISANAELYIQGYIEQNGKQVGNEISGHIKLKTSLVQNTKYDFQLQVNATLSHLSDVTFSYQVIPAESIEVDVPSFN